MMEFLNNILLPHIPIALQEETKLANGKGALRSDLAMEIQPLEELEITSVNEPKPLEPSKAAADEEVTELEHQSAINGDNYHQTEDGVPDHFSRRHRLPKILVRWELEPLQRRRAYCVAVFSHGMAVNCALRGLLGSDPQRSHQVYIDKTSVTVLKHSSSRGWQVQRVGDTAHLRLL